jgi:antitoxin (DNA-binding transcriptional repressor) of toxin-antitoxin stability system
MEFRNNERIPISTLRSMTSEIVSQAGAGKSFVITHHGAAIAVLSPAFGKPTRVSKTDGTAAIAAGVSVGAGIPPVLNLPIYDPTKAAG